MGFVESYKRLDRLCGDILSTDRGVSAYIDEMKAVNYGRRYVWTWDDDLRSLLRCRHIRNKIVHEPGCTEQNMCLPGDELWLNEFYGRVIGQTDPLCIYYRTQRMQRSPRAQQPERQVYTPPAPSGTRRKSSGCFIQLVITLSAIAACVGMLIK